MWSVHKTLFLQEAWDLGTSTSPGIDLIIPIMAGEVPYFENDSVIIFLENSYHKEKVFWEDCHMVIDLENIWINEIVLEL